MAPKLMSPIGHCVSGRSFRSPLLNESFAVVYLFFHGWNPPFISDGAVTFTSRVPFLLVIGLCFSFPRTGNSRATIPRLLMRFKYNILTLLAFHFPPTRVPIPPNFLRVWESFTSKVAVGTISRHCAGCVLHLPSLVLGLTPELLPSQLGVTARKQSFFSTHQFFPFVVES